ncbi:MAG TPA: hypothetical protein DD381_13885 [Lentisphaeria bacterium]|nr:MAG: hypothetical protein A2X47_13640 [Lentisphaerae bacterium GWF2_38_69]HBM17413.1 hypothetical protein [Lentisphaeria bacterium]
MKTAIKKLIILITGLFIAIAGVGNAFADSTYLDNQGNSFVLGKGGSRMFLQSHGNAKVVIVGNLGGKYVAMLNYTEVKPLELVGKLFLVDNVNASGSCTWDGNKTSIINIEGKMLDQMTYIHGSWGHSYMQIFWFDMRERFGDKQDIWAVSSSCESNKCFLFQYEEIYDDTAKCIKERKLKYVNYWNFDFCIKGIDVIDLNSVTIGAEDNDKRCPPIFVEVSRQYGTPNGTNGDFWGIANYIFFHNIKMNAGCPNKDDLFGCTTNRYNVLEGYDKKYVEPAKNTHTTWGGICGGGASGLGGYIDDNKPTYAYYTMESWADIYSYHVRGPIGSRAREYSWNIFINKHTFTYDNANRRFNSLISACYTQNSFYEYWEDCTAFNDFSKKIAGLFGSCSTILFDCRGPKISMDEGKNLWIKGDSITGTKIEGYVGDKFKAKKDCFIGQIQTKKSTEKEGQLIGEYSKDAKGEALRRCDEQGRQVLAIFLGYSPTALIKGESADLKLSVNFKNVKTSGVETGSGISSEWSMGYGRKGAVLPVEAHAGYKGYLNNMITKGSGDVFTASVFNTVTFDNKNIKENRDKGIIFFEGKHPILTIGELVWDEKIATTVRGWGIHRGINYNIIPIAGGVFSDQSQGYFNYFDLYNPGNTWDQDQKIYSAMTDGLENKDNWWKGVGNLFEFEKEAELIKLVDDGYYHNYRILGELKELADMKVQPGKDTFKDRAVKWLAPSSPDKHFGYDWKETHTFDMDFTQFTNRNDVINEGHGGYWKFSVFGPESEGKVTTQSSSRTYTNSSTTNGYGYVTHQVNGLSRNYSIKYYGFMINPREYKQMQINKNVPATRPAFIPEYAWDRDQSFALFVPAIYGSSKQMTAQ